MNYVLVLTNGKELNCLTDSHERLMEMLFKHNIYIVQENTHPLESTYVMPENVSHVRVQGKDKIEPI
jgi:hypothetical protein